MKKNGFGKSEVKYFGYVVTFGKFCIEEEKVQSMKDWPVPTSIKELQ